MKSSAATPEKGIKETKKYPKREVEARLYTGYTKAKTQVKQCV